MRRLLGFAVLLMAVNFLCQAVLVLVTRTIDLSFGGLAALVLIPLFQASILVLAAPAGPAGHVEPWSEALLRDRPSLSIAVMLLAAAAVFVASRDPATWKAAVIAALVILSCLTLACFAIARGTKRGALLLTSAGCLLFAADVARGFLRRLPPRFESYPTVVVLLATYVPLFVLTILVLLATQRAMGQRCVPAGRLVDVATLLVLAGSLVVAGNYFHHPMVAPGWMPVVRACELFALASMIVAAILFLRHERGGHVEAA